MSPLPSHLLNLRRTLADCHEELRNLHDGGAGGREVCEALAQRRDNVLRALFTAAWEHASGAASRDEVALVALGGYGRGVVAPFSDVDVMILHAPAAAEAAEQLARRLLGDVFDVGLVLGHSVRTPQQACRLAADEPTIYTSLIDTRLLAGGQALFEQLRELFDQQLGHAGPALCRAVDAARRAERAQFGETVYLAEPNVKCSPGGLRDLNLVRWIGHARFGAADPAQLVALGVLARDDEAALADAGEFLLRIRNELHFHAGRAADVLDRAAQAHVARRFGYRDEAGILPVERFMRDYFRRTQRVGSIVTRFVERANQGQGIRQTFASVFSRRMGREYRLSPSQIRATRFGLDCLRGDLVEVLRLVDLSCAYDKPIAAETWEVIRRSAARLRGTNTPESNRRFLALLARSSRLAEVLRSLHEVELLEEFVPALAHARGLLQYNQYHKYTVDEHCLRAVEQATSLAADAGPLGRVYRGLRDKTLLHLAILIHDLGKGYPEDHSVVGGRIARETAARLGLSSAEIETLVFLVEHHLLMNHLALRRDTDDEGTVVQLAVDVGSPQRLGLLYVMTAADLAAVGPGVWTSWKSELLASLFHRTMQHLAGESPVAQPNAKIADDLGLLDGIAERGAVAQGRYLPASHAVQLTIATTEDIVPGIFHRLTGALSAAGLQILSAQIHTLADGRVLDRFWVHDPDHAGPPPPERIAQIEFALVRSLREPAGERPVFRRLWQRDAGPAVLHPAARTRVECDNTTSSQFTILDVFAADRRGLLFTIARTLFELDLSVCRAKIGTYLDQVVDVFYVTDRSGDKIRNQDRLDHVCQTLRDAIEQYEPAP